MSFRRKLLLAGLPLAILPLAFFGLRVRADIGARLGAQYAERVAALANVIGDEIARESDAVAARLRRLAEAMAEDNRLRLTLVAGRSASAADRAYLLDYAGRGMRTTGLDMLRLQDEDGRVLSSGHFRNEYDVIDRELPAAVREADDAGVLVSAPTPTDSVLVLARADSVSIGGRTIVLVGGTAVDERFLDRLAGGTGLDVALDRASVAEYRNRAAGAGIGFDTAATAALAGGLERSVPIAFAGDDGARTARFVVSASTAPLQAIRRDFDRWLLVAVGGTAVLALVLALFVSAGLGRPLAELARKAGRLDLDRLHVRFASGRADEVGDLSRVLDRMTYRLRTSTARLREAERRAAVGDIARQVNHDVRNGLIPIRNVVGHLAELARDEPEALPNVFRERQGTLESSIDYLHSLAANYARLSPRSRPQRCDLNAIAREIAEDSPARIETDLAGRLPRVQADPIALRRIVENLVVNAVESLDGDNGRVVVSTRLERAGGGTRIRLAVEDTGQGMSAEERARIFDDFYTTKPGGTGLGLSIVRRLVNDLGGRIIVDSEPGTGTRFTVELPAGTTEAEE